MSWRNAKDWFKAPVLQGPENDYGDYDYLIEELPKNYARWELTREKYSCYSCRKESHLILRSEQYFYTLDGYDSMDYAECWKCRLKGKINSVVWRIKKKIKTVYTRVKDAIDLSKESPTKSFMYYYKLLKRIDC